MLRCLGKVSLSNLSAPRACFIAWLVLWGKIRTKDLMVQWQVTSDQACELCSTQDEDLPHLFFSYAYSAAVWNAMLHWIHVPHTVLPWQEERGWVERKCKGNSYKAKILKLCFVTTVYHLWMERTDRLFRYKFTAPYRLVDRIKYQVLLRGSADVKVYSLLLSNVIWVCLNLLANLVMDNTLPRR